MDQYKTSSLALAAALQAVSKSKLDQIVFSPNGRAEFCFEKSLDPNFDKRVSQFWDKTLSVDAFTYFESLKYLKSRLYGEKR